MQVRAKYIISVYAGAFSNADFFVRVMKPRYYLRGVSEMYLCVRATLLSSDYFVRSTLKCPKEKSVDTLRSGAMKQSNPSNDDRFHVTTLRTNVDHDTEYRRRRYSQSVSRISVYQLQIA